MVNLETSPSLGEAAGDRQIPETLHFWQSAYTRTKLHPGGTGCNKGKVIGCVAVVDASRIRVLGSSKVDTAALVSSGCDGQVSAIALLIIIFKVQNGIRLGRYYVGAPGRMRKGSVFPLVESRTKKLASLPATPRSGGGASLRSRPAPGATPGCCST